MEPPPEPQLERFVHALMITGGWLMELMSGFSVELPKGTYPGEDPRAVVFEMLCGTIGTALHSAEPRDLQRATELIDLAASRVEEHLRLACEQVRMSTSSSSRQPSKIRCGSRSA